MSAWPNWGAVGGGALASNFVLIAVFHSFGAVGEIVKSRDPRGSSAAFLSQVLVGFLLNAGPWTLVAGAALAYYVSGESWASSFFAGAVGWSLLYAVAIAWALLY